MKNNSKWQGIVLLMGLCAGSLHAQENTSTSGGDASGSNGTASYTIGQAFYQTQKASGGTVTQGIQQAYDVSVVTGHKRTVNLSTTVYPNPTTDVIVLSTEEKVNFPMRYLLTDANGITIMDEAVYDSSTRIAVDHLNSGTYFLKVIHSQSDVKTFKIIKYK